VRGQTTRVTFAGSNLSSATGLAIYPPDGITVSNMVSGPSSVAMDVAVDAAAVLGSRMVAVTNPQGRSVAAMSCR